MGRLEGDPTSVLDLHDPARYLEIRGTGVVGRIAPPRQGRRHERFRTY